jgi:4-amino-4-deoxy-L-arabinose transferase
MPLIFLSLSKGKLLTYLLPCFAPLSILTAVGLERYFAAGHRRAFHAAACVLGAMVAGVLALLVAAQLGALGAALYSPAEWIKADAFAGFLILALGSAAIACFDFRPIARVLAVGGSGAALLLALQLALPARILDAISPVTAVASFAPVAADTVVVADGSLFGTAAWAFERNDVYVVEPGEIEYGLSYPESRHRWLRGAMLAELVAASRGRNEVLVLCIRKNEPLVADQMPAAAQRAEMGKVVSFRVPP